MQDEKQKKEELLEVLRAEVARLLASESGGAYFNAATADDLSML